MEVEEVSEERCVTSEALDDATSEGGVDRRAGVTAMGWTACDAGLLIIGGDI